MTDDADHVVLVLPRGDRGELRLSRSRYQGKTFTKLHLWYPTDDGELRPGRQVVTIRDGEIDRVIDSLQKIRSKVNDGVGRSEPRGRTQHRDDDRHAPQGEIDEGLF